MQTSHKEQPTIKVLGRLDINGHDILKRIYSIDGYCPTLTTMMGGQTQPKVVIQRKHE
jgi:DNA (cytosine-5)-methyltransferase 1